MEEWKACAEHLPDEGEIVLAVDYSGEYPNVEFAYLYDGEFWLRAADDRMIDPRYWMRVPAPPKE